MKLPNDPAVGRRLRQLGTMLRIRYFEERLDRLFSRGALGGTCHLCIGQEAVAVGVCDQLRAGDRVVSSHRGHGHLIAMGGSLDRMFGELMEREIGYCRGRGGTQHLCAADIGFYGTNGITGGGIPIATGLGLAAKRDARGGVVVSFFGDGAVNQGTFHESLNMAAMWQLPVIFVCENNLYAMSTSFDRVSLIPDVYRRAEAYGMVGLVADGSDLADVDAKSAEAFAIARSGRGPVLLEAKTYRHHGHSKSDRRAYRTKEEEERWRSRDCVTLLQETLVAMGYGDEAKAAATEVLAEIDAAESIAEASPFAEAGTPAPRN
ncbi:MAG: thiamine pyrophosphate-dependent dehydrogenase E1 component subunit alpha [Alphaproteobacteria bacterium]|nr:thiamine pyrophosphate-dependent dehydrogenase E1 component subunit alpha [Alphaproteobacteria bacterium]